MLPSACFYSQIPRSRSRDSNGQANNSDEDETVLSGIEDDESGGNTTVDGTTGPDGKGGKARKKKTRTVFSRSQVNN